MADILIRNAEIVDGTGAPRYRGDVRISGEKIEAIAPNLPADGREEIDASGLCLAPGFVDPHTHSDMTLLVDSKAESKIRQGVTTEVVGNCGSSPAPLIGAALEESRAEMDEYGLAPEWTDMAGYVDQLLSRGVALNVVPLVGHNTVRGAVLGYGDVQPDEDQLKAMQDLTRQAIRQGAKGMSTGLYYPPGFYAKTPEVIAVARAAAEEGGLYASHIRSESDTLFEAVDEAIEIGKGAGIDVQISHLKLEGEHNFAGADRLLEKIERANDGRNVVNCDQYPYVASNTWLAACLPNWAQAGGGKAVAARLKDEKIRAELRADYMKNKLDWDNRSGVTRWDQILLSNVPGREELNGKTLAEAAEVMGVDGLDALFDLIRDTDANVWAAYFDQLEENVQKLMQYERLMTSSDGSALAVSGPLGKGNPHPRNFGTFPRVLGRYVRELGVLSLEKAIHKMTQLPATMFRLAGRGVIREGAYADLVLFDPQTVIDRSTFGDSKQYPAGIPWVIVNGVPVIVRGEHSGRLPGKVV